MGTEATPAAGTDAAAATPNPPAAGAASAAGAGSNTPADTTQAKAGETAAASASTGTADEKKLETPPGAKAEDEAKDEKPKDGEGEDGKPADADAPKDEPLALTLPDGFVKDEAVLGEFQALAKEMGLKGEAAQKLVDLHVRMQESFVKSVQAEQAALTAEWKKQVLADVDTYGGQPYEAITATATKSLKKYGSPELLAVLEETGLGNHPAVIKTFHTIGKALREDSVAGRSGGAPVKSSLSAEEQLLRKRYPTMYPPEE